MEKTFIIAEAGVNHNGQLDLALKMVDLAVKAGADAIKFQTFIADKEISKNAPKAEYQKATTDSHESQLEMARKLELSDDAHRQLKSHCELSGIQFISTPSDLDSIDFLAGLGLEVLKIASGDINVLPHLRKIGRLRKKVILSTGMSNLDEVGNAIEILIKAGTRKEDITVLQCNTEYPTPLEDVNLRAMNTIRDVFGVRVGYSDHTQGIEVAIAAVALGASIIEKHFTLDKAMTGPDHAASIEPQEFMDMVRCIRNIEVALGDPNKKVSKSEKKNKDIARKSVVASRNICAGEVLSEDNITVKRPGTGLDPMLWDAILGTKAKKNFVEDDFIEV